MGLLENERIDSELSNLPAWARDGDQIVKRYDFPDFVAAIEFVRRVADRAEAANHHPDIAIHYNKVTLTLSTHSEGGITEKDIEGARSFDAAMG
jgi:4a-hydroxytetrahydrobiopterin dehydratase